MSATLNGWTAPRLDDLARDVAEIKHDLAEMRAEDMADLKHDLQEAREEAQEAKRRPRDQLTAYVAPLIAGLIPTLVLLIHG